MTNPIRAYWCGIGCDSKCWVRDYDRKNNAMVQWVS
jgi:hypothetical protein